MHPKKARKYMKHQYRSIRFIRPDKNDYNSIWLLPLDTGYIIGGSKKRFRDLCIDIHQECSNSIITSQSN